MINLDHLPGLMEPIARELLGEPNRAMSSAKELRYGSHGSLAVDITKGTYYDHETGQGGGVLDFIKLQTGLDGREREQWIGERWPDAVEEHRPRLNGSGNGKHKAAAKPATETRVPLGKPVKIYDYTDEQGDLIFQVCRYEPKTFRQRRLDEHGEWTWQVRGVRPVPYQLPDLIETAALGHIIFIVEGEKDVDRLRSIGATATCNAGGAGKWPGELSEFFRDAHVVVIADNDPQARRKDGSLRTHEDGRPVYPGQDHAWHVCESLIDVAADVRLLDLKTVWPECPLKGDVSDWIEGGGTIEQLYAVSEKLPVWSPDQPRPEAERPDLPKLEYMNLPSLVGLAVPTRDWVVLNRIPARNVTLLSGDGGVGKTLLAQQLAVATVLGRDWIGTMPKPGPVILYSAEDDADEIHLRLSKIVEHYGVGFDALRDLHIVSLVGKDTVLAAAGAHGLVKPTALFETICRDVKEIAPVWIGIDTAADAFVVEERDRSQARQCINLLRGLAYNARCAVILLSHPSLSGMASGSGLSGSTGWNNSVRSRLYLRSAKNDDDDDAGAIADPDIRVLETMKSNYAAKGETISLRWRDGVLVMDGQAAAPENKYVNVEQSAVAIFKRLLAGFNQDNRPVGANSRANNGGPALFAELADAKPLHHSKRVRKRLLREAMESLLKAKIIVIDWGPKGARRGKQTQCLYIAPADEEARLL